MTRIFLGHFLVLVCNSPKWLSRMRKGVKSGAAEQREATQSAASYSRVSNNRVGTTLYSRPIFLPARYYLPPARVSILGNFQGLEKLKFHNFALCRYNYTIYTTQLSRPRAPSGLNFFIFLAFCHRRVDCIRMINVSRSLKRKSNFCCCFCSPFSCSF